jgi:RNA polymerase sigma factor (sigma-70 family)
MQIADAPLRTEVTSRNRRSGRSPTATRAVLCRAPGMRTSPFPKTKWTVISRAGAGDDPKAFREIFEAYWYPVYAFVRRRRHGSAEDARDLTQGFFARMSEKQSLQQVDRNYGSKFRAWLLRCVEHYLANEHDHAHAQMRDPGSPIESLDGIAAEGRYWAEPANNLTPERLFDRELALALLARVVELLRLEYASRQDEALFDALKGCLSGDAELRPNREIGADLGMKEGAVKTAATRLRDRYRNLLRSEVASLLTDPDENAINEELRHLLAAIEQ